MTIAHQQLPSEVWCIDVTRGEKGDTLLQTQAFRDAKIVLRWG